MMAPSHVLTGIAGWGLTTQFTGYEFNEFTLVAAMAGSLLPDIDHPKSWLGRRLLPISLPLTVLIGHRGLTHSLLAVLAMVGVLFLWAPEANQIIAPLAVGYLIHLLGDLVTNSGVPLFWPAKRRFSFPLASTGGISEYLVVAVFTVTAGYFQREQWITAWGDLTLGLNT